MEESPTKHRKLNGDAGEPKKYGMGELFATKLMIKEPHGKSVNGIKISPNGSSFCTCSSDGVVRVYEMNTGELVAKLVGHSKGVSDLAYSPINSDIVASCSDDFTIRVWSIRKRACLKILKKHTYHVTTIEFSLKGNLLISGSADETITIWDIITGVTLKTLAAHSDPVLSIALSPDSTMIVSASFDGLMRLFDLETGYCLKTLTYNSSSHGTATASTTDVVNFPISHVEFSPNGKYILSSSLDGVIRLWDYMDNKIMKTYLGTLNGKIPIAESVCCGTKFITRSEPPLVVSGSEKQGILAWNVQTKDIVFQLQNSSSTILDVDVFDGGRILAFCDMNGTVGVLEMDPTYLDRTKPFPQSNSATNSPKIE